MTAVCDFCTPSGQRTGDRDKPYRYGNLKEAAMRLTPEERRVFLKMRQHVRDVQAGYSEGPAFGDLAADPAAENA